MFRFHPNIKSDLNGDMDGGLLKFIDEIELRQIGTLLLDQVESVGLNGVE